MKRLFAGALAAIATIAFGQVAFAADLRVKAPIAPSPMAAPGWTGFYAGLNLGWGWTNDRSTSFVGNDPATGLFLSAGIAVPAGGTSPTTNASGLNGGLQFGYNWQFAPSWILGFETDFQGSSLDDTSSSAFSVVGVPFTSNAHQDLSWFGTVRARLGFLITPDWLLYGTGGFAYGRVNESYSISGGTVTVVVPTFGFTCVAASVCASGSNSDIRTGWTAGGGVEWRVPNITLANNPVSVKVEYLFVNLGGQDIRVPTQTNPAASFQAHFEDATFSVVRLGVNVRF